MKYRKVMHDITVTLKPNMVNWPGKRHLYKHEYVKSFDAGDDFNVSRIHCSLHCGTHVDAPYHKIKSGKKLNDYNMQRFMGDAYLVDLTGVQTSIELNDVRQLDLQDCRICLFKTMNSKLLEKEKFDPDFVFMKKEAADFLVDKGIRAVGIDYFSIDASDSDEPHTHNAFFTADVLIYEGLDLRNVCEGKYYFIGLPLKIQNAEGSPVRALLFDAEYND
jgi:arylformamidase